MLRIKTILVAQTGTRGETRAINIAKWEREKINYNLYYYSYFETRYLNNNNITTIPADLFQTTPFITSL